MNPLSFRRTALIIIFPGILVAHGAYGNVLPDPLNIQAEAPEWGTAAAALDGVDLNGDKVRDDLEPFIFEHFGKRPHMLRAISNVVISLQLAIRARTDYESSKAHSMFILSSECFAASEEKLADDKQHLLTLVEMIVNTPQREAALAMHHKRIAERNFIVRNEPKWDAYCERRVDLIDNSSPRQPRRE